MKPPRFFFGRGRGAKISDRRWGRAVICGILTLAVLIVLAYQAQLGIEPARKTDKAPGKIAAPTDIKEDPDKGERLCAIRLGDRCPVPPDIEPGDKVDIVGSFPPDASGDAYTKTIIRAAGVVDMSGSAGQAILTIAVSPEEAEKLAFTAANGIVSITLCPAGPDTSTQSGGMTIDGL
ncbi:MAG: hypothetical protein ABH838_01205 [Actinomycetota bacterium]